MQPSVRVHRTSSAHTYVPDGQIGQLGLRLDLGNRLAGDLDLGESVRAGTRGREKGKRTTGACLSELVVEYGGLERVVVALRICARALREPRNEFAYTNEG